MPDLKPITVAGVTAALQKAHRYRLLNDAAAAESICLDILAIEPGNTEALVTLVLALTDQFEHTRAEGLRRARESAGQLRDEYSRAYYSGLVFERWAKVLLRLATPGNAELAYDWIHRAMESYERAERVRPAGDDDAILRWNACVRLLRSEPNLRPGVTESYEAGLE